MAFKDINGTLWIFPEDFVDNRKLWRAKVMAIDEPTGEDIKMMEEGQDRVTSGYALVDPPRIKGMASREQHAVLAGDLTSKILERGKVEKVMFNRCILSRLVEALLDLEG